MNQTIVDEIRHELEGNDECVTVMATLLAFGDLGSLSRAAFVELMWTAVAWGYILGQSECARDLVRAIHDGPVL